LKEARHAEEEKITALGQVISEKLYFIRQHVRNACGTIAVVHALANSKEALKIESGALHDFLLKTTNNTPSERGHLLGTDENMTKFHHESSRMGATNPKDFAKADFHFVCFTAVDGYLYEMDGTKKFPINHGPTTQQRMLLDAASVIQKNFVQNNPGEIFFSLITLGPAQGDEIIPQELEKPKEISEEAVDQGKVAEMMGMGFTYNQAIFGLRKRSNKTQQAIEYILSHPDVSQPMEASPSLEVNESYVTEITSMGFSREAAIQALALHHTLENALNFLLS